MKISCSFIFFSFRKCFALVQISFYTFTLRRVFSIGALLSVKSSKSFFLLVLPKVDLRLSSSVVPVGSRLTCSATAGISPIYIAIIRNSATLMNTINTASIQVNEEGNYTCRATSKYGTDEKKFVVRIAGKETENTHFLSYYVQEIFFCNCRYPLHRQKVPICKKRKLCFTVQKLQCTQSVVNFVQYSCDTTTKLPVVIILFVYCFLTLFVFCVGNTRTSL